MSSFKLLYFLIFIINVCKINSQISDKRLCVDSECKVPISHAKTLLRYSSPDSRILSFGPNVDVTIYSKSAGSRLDLWGAEIKGKRGYVPKHLIRETKILEKPAVLVDTESINSETQQVPSLVEPNKVQEPYEVVDGTTIYFTPQDAIDPTVTESPAQATATPDIATESNVIGLQDEPAEEEVITQDEQKEPEIEVKTEEALSDSTTNEETPPKIENSELESNVNKSIDEPTSNEESEDDIEDEDDDEDDEEEDDTVEELEAVEDLDVPNEQEEPTNTDTLQEAESVLNSVLNESVEAKIEEYLTNNEEAKSTVDSETLTDLINSTQNPTISDSNNTSTESDPDEVLHNPDLEKIQSTEEAAQVELIDNKDEINKAAEVVQEANVTSDIKVEEILQEVIPEPEVTTLSPEIEVPQPHYDDSLAEVTPDPLESSSEETKADDVLTSLPPLGLFGGGKINEPSTENLVISENNSGVTEEIKKDIVPDENSETVKLEEPVVESVTSERAQDFSFVEEQKADVSDLASDLTTQEVERSEETSNLSAETLNKEVNELPDDFNKNEEKDENAISGIFSSIMSMFASSSEEKVDEGVVKEEVRSDHSAEKTEIEGLVEKHMTNENVVSQHSTEQFCDASPCGQTNEKEPTSTIMIDLLNFNPDTFLYLVTTAISVIIFLFGYIAFDKNKREGPLIAKINKLEKELLITVKENQILQERASSDSYDKIDAVSNDLVENLRLELVEVTNKKFALEEQVQSLEKELENSTEVGMELNRMLTEILSSESGSDVLKANVEHLQRQLVEQQATVNSVNETLAITNTENHELRLELELTNKKVVDLQAELNKLLLNILKIEEEKEAQQASLENEISGYKRKYEEIDKKVKTQEDEYCQELRQLKNRLEQTERSLNLKIKEHGVLTETIRQLKAMKSNDGLSVQSLLDVSEIKAELELLKSENQNFRQRLQEEEQARIINEKRAKAAIEEVRSLQEKYEEADKIKVETATKLEVLSNYFKDREAQLQKEIAKHESLWVEKQGEATSTTERVRFMQEQLQNYKAQTESLKHEIVSQEVELKSQISVLEKKGHENWVSARQAERKLEEAKQEAAQLRHRLTLRERALQEDKTLHRYQSPIEQNGDLPESPASPPLLYGTSRDHMTKSPPIPGLPPFLPPPPGVPFMPPPLHGVPPFIPPPPNMYPGDHRPPPLGRMSSPPLNSRYSPSSRGYSPYDSSPSDSEYGTSPPQRRGYSPFNGRSDDRRDYKRPPPGRSNGRSMLKDGVSSGSGHSNESLDKINRQQSKV